MARPRRRSASQVAQALDCDPFRYLCMRFNESEDGKEKDDLALSLLPYCYPRLKQVDADIAVQGEVTVVIGGEVPSPNEVIEGTAVSPNEVIDDG